MAGLKALSVVIMKIGFWAKTHIRRPISLKQSKFSKTTHDFATFKPMFIIGEFRSFTPKYSKSWDVAQDVGTTS